MIFDEIPFELKEHIFTYVTPNEWINTAKVSNEWMDLTLGSIKKIELCHVLILDHLAEFINEQQNTNYTWVSLLTLMPRLEHLKCCEITEAFWQEISPVCHQLKSLDYKPRNAASFDWNTLDIRFDNLTELLWDGSFSGHLLSNWTYVRPVFPFKLLAFSPNLQKIEATNFEINAEWQIKIPKFVKHILLKKANFTDEQQCSVNYLCEDTSVLETFYAEGCMLPWSISSEFFEETPLLKKVGLEFMISDATTSMILQNAFKNCRGLETVKAQGVIITDSWQRVIPQNVRSIDFCKMNVQENIRSDFSLDWLFQNYDYLQSLQVTFGTWIGFDSQKFYSTKNLKKLALDNYMSLFAPGRDRPIDPFSDICLRMIRGSHLVDVKICGMTIDDSWRHIFPPTVERLKMEDFRLSKEAQLVFSPQFLCQNPSNIKSLIFGEFNGDLPAMNLNAFTGMQMLQKLKLNLRLSGECLQSILTHCSALTKLFVRGLTAGALTNIPRHLILPSLRQLRVKQAFDHSSLLMQYFPKVRTVDILPSGEYFSDILCAMEVAETVEIKIRNPTWHLVLSLIEDIKEAKFEYFCITCESYVISFYLTNLIMDACTKLNDLLIFKEYHNVLRISNNFPTSPILRKNVSRIPSSIDELSKLYHELIAAD